VHAPPLDRVSKGHVLCVAGKGTYSALPELSGTNLGGAKAGTGANVAAQTISLPPGYSELYTESGAHEMEALDRR
jgi:hypothetical protein